MKASKKIKIVFKFYLMNILAGANDSRAAFKNVNVLFW